MGKRRNGNFKLNKKKKDKYVQKEKYVKREKYDYSKINGRVIGQLPDGEPIIGSKSMRVSPLTIDDLSQLEIKCINNKIFLSKAHQKFEDVMDKCSYNSVWDE